MSVSITLNYTADRIVAVGASGPAGPANTLTIGTVTTVAAGGSATASISGTAPNQTLSLGVPTGATGAQGDWSAAQTVRTWSSGTTLSSSDAGKLINLDNATGVTVGTALNLAAGQRIDFIQTHGTVASPTFTASNVTLNGTPSKNIRAQYSAVTLLCLSSNNYVLVGDLAVS